MDNLSFLRSKGAESAEDAEELWKRIDLIWQSPTRKIICQSRLLLSREVWRLPQIHDVNPSPYGDSLALNVSDTDNNISIELTLEVSEYSSFLHTQARQEAEERFYPNSKKHRG